jgi:transposase
MLDYELEPKAVRRRGSRKRERVSARDTGMIEIEAGGVIVRIARGADAKAVAAVKAAWKAAR